MRIPALLLTLLIALVVSPSASAQVQLPQLPKLPQLPSTPAPPPAPVNPQGVAPSDPNPLLGMRFYVDRVEQPAAKWHQRYVRSGQSGTAALMNKIASQPIFRWIGKSDENPERNTRVFLQRAAERAPGTVPGITVLAHHGEKCGRGYTAGGRRLDARYRRWMSRFVEGLGNRRVIVALEPDALGTLKCLHRSRRASRLRNINYATQLLARKPNVTTYIEAGASDWRPAREMARYLRSAGVHRVRGFSLNITHFDTSPNNVRYGRQISRMLGGKHFVVNTDENGVGRVWYRRWISRARNQWKTVNVWCNPRRSALGTPPQAVNDPQLDGYLWMSRPGASAGSCRGWNPRYSMRGGPSAGSFWVERALSLARQARW
jgi:endoglucanase